LTQQCFFIRLYIDTTVQVGYTITGIKKKFHGYCDFSQLSANNEVEKKLMVTQNQKDLFLQLIQENRGIIFRICNSYCQTKNDREDLAQEIIYQLWKSSPGFDHTNKFSTWMYRIALNVAISFYRKTQRNTPFVSLDENETAFNKSEETSNEKEENLLLLQQFINELPELDRALMLLYLDAKPAAEIAEILGITETNVTTKISRIKEKLKQKFSSVK